MICHLLLQKENLQHEGIMFLLKFVHFRLMDIFFTVDQKVANILMSLH